jgi:hypothetical protein
VPGAAPAAFTNGGVEDVAVGEAGRAVQAGCRRDGSQQIGQGWHGGDCGTACGAVEFAAPYRGHTGPAAFALSVITDSQLKRLRRTSMP